MCAIIALKDTLYALPFEKISRLIHSIFLEIGVKSLTRFEAPHFSTGQNLLKKNIEKR